MHVLHGSATLIMQDRGRGPLGGRRCPTLRQSKQSPEIRLIDPACCIRHKSPPFKLLHFFLFLFLFLSFLLHHAVAVLAILAHSHSLIEHSLVTFIRSIVDLYTRFTALVGSYSTRGIPKQSTLLHQQKILLRNLSTILSIKP